MTKQKIKNYGFMQNGQFKVATLIDQTPQEFAAEQKLDTEFVELSGPEVNNEFFSAHEVNGGAVKLNIEEAKDVKMDQIRLLRNKKLQELDTDFIMALEEDDLAKKNEVVTEKKRLRDLPNDPEFSKISDIKELTAYDPKIDAV